MLRDLVRQLFTAPAGADAHARRGAEARDRGDWESALNHFLAAVRLDDARADAWNDIGLVYCARGEFVLAREAYSRAVERDARLLPAALNLAALMREEFLDFCGAERHYRNALALDPSSTDAMTGLGLSLQEQGRVDEAVACFRQALDVDPRLYDAGQCLLFALNLIPGLSAEVVFAEHLRWAERHVQALGRPAPAPRAPGPVRLGFVSGDLRGHSTASFALPLLANLDRSRFAIYCYNACARTDATTARFRTLAAAWREIHALHDDAAAQLIREDAIDVLVDLSGHTRGNRLGVFARRPAPVAMAWLGYLNTTGMTAIDYRVASARSDPPEADAFHTESLLRLPETSWCYAADPDAPRIEARPPGGELVFGSCNHVCKLNQEVIGVWSAILRDVPQARLSILAVPDAPARERLAAAFERSGVPRSRIEMHARCSRGEYWRLLQNIDIALDSFPYNGGATTCDCLWMGVPAVTLAGRFGFARSAAGILGSAGLSELVASDAAHYHAIAVELARNPGALSALRSGLRERLRASPMMDAPRLAGAFGDAVIAALERAGAGKPC